MTADASASLRPRCGVLGSPIRHSLSPVLHRAAYDALSLDWRYDACDVDEAALPGFLAGLGPQWRGLSLTMPLKQAVISHCASVTRTARQTSAVNTVVVGGDGRLTGHNTDVPGFLATWREAGVGSVNSAVVLGAGATARSAAAALAQLGVLSVSVRARAPERASLLVALLNELGVDGTVSELFEDAAPQGVDLLVSTVPVAAQAQLLAVEPVAEIVARAEVVFDASYGVEATPLVAARHRLGRPVADGFGLLLHQAARQVELMTGRAPAPLERMRQAGLAALAVAREATHRLPGASVEV